MDFENHESSTSSSPLSPFQYSPCNSNSPSQPQSPLISHKRKAGRKKFKETRHPVYRGVRQRNGNRWVCEVREPMKKSRIWLGTFPTPEMAARAHDVAVLALRGTSAALNFPDSAWLVARPKSSSARDIQIAAFEAAEAFRPMISSFSSSSSSSSSSPTDMPNVKRKEEVLETSLLDMPTVESERKVLEPSSIDSTCIESSNKLLNLPTTLFMDEEAFFNMPGFLNSMAEGMLLTPPAMRRGFNWDNMFCEMELNLWRD